MDSAQYRFWKDVVPVVRQIGRRAFAGQRDYREKMADAISEAWVQFESAPPVATPFSIASYSVRRIKVRRQFKHSERSLTGPNPRRKVKAKRQRFFPRVLADGRHRPEEFVIVRVDVREWFATLTKRQQMICLGALMGDSTKEMANQLGITPAAVSQIRRKLIELWEAYTV